ncbi:hypothetical protein [Spongiimicrobium sp. 3-5]
MNAKKILFGILACGVLMAASCESSNTADDELYEQGVDKSKVRTSNKA